VVLQLGRVGGREFRPARRAAYCGRVGGRHDVLSDFRYIQHLHRRFSRRGGSRSGTHQNQLPPSPPTVSSRSPSVRGRRGSGCRGSDRYGPREAPFRVRASPLLASFATRNAQDLSVVAAAVRFQTGF
jgi:hypothetical protein